MKKDKIIRREIYLETTQLNEKLKLFAETLLDKDFDEFQKMFFDLKNLSSGDFSQKYANWLKNLFESDANEINNLEPSQWYFVDYRPECQEKYVVSPEQFLIDFAQQKGKMAWVDWSGEDADGDVADIVDRMLKRNWCTDFEWDIDEFESELDFDTLERGDYILKLFEAIDSKLKAKGFQLIFFQVGDDAYHYSVLPIKLIDKLQKLCLKEKKVKEYCRVYIVNISSNNKRDIFREI
ncbi:MAG: hypothetical protein LBE12_05390 [Planctomycetaceae bacterium]|nr:hypothetical protein [Planctomycetaceae bacterium]